MRANYWEILQLLLQHVYFIISIKEQYCQVLLVTLFKDLLLLLSSNIFVGNSSSYQSSIITPQVSKQLFMDTKVYKAL